MANANIATIAVTNTFDDWRTRTNDLITDRNILRNHPYVKDNSNFTVANGTVLISRSTGGTLLTLAGGGDALIGGTTTTTDLIVGDDASVANQLSVTGNTVITGNLSVGTNSTFTQNVTVIGTANVTADLKVAGNTTLQSNLTVSKNATVTQNATVAGTLNVTGDTALASNLAVTANTTLSSNLSVSRNVAVSQNATITGTLNSGAATLASLGVTGAATVGTTLGVTGNTSLSSNLAVTGNATVSQNVTVTGTLNSGAATLASLGVTGAATVGTTLGVTGNISSANISVGNKVLGSVLESNVATGTAPLTVASTTKVTNLNADLLDGYDSSSAATPATIALRTGDGSLLANLLYGTLATAAQPNVTSLGTLTSLGVSGTATVGTTLGVTGNTALSSNLTVNGNLGIGTSSPSAKLDVTGTFNGTQAVFGNTSGRGLLIGTALNGGVNEGSSVLNSRGAGNGQFLFQTDGTTRMTLTDAGNLGIGTASPSVKLDVVGGIRSIVSGGTPIIYLNNGPTEHRIQNEGNAFTFYNNTTERMRIDAFGGISMSANLTVTGNATVTGTANLNGRTTATNIVLDTAGNYTINQGNVVFNNVTISGTQVNQGSILNDSDLLVLRAATITDGNATLRSRRAGLGNAEIRFVSASGVWQATANANLAYSTLLTTGNIVTTITSTSTTDVASPSAVKTAYDLASNTVMVSANGGSTLTNKQLNFTNTASINVTVSTGTSSNADIAFSANTSNPAALGPQGVQGAQGRQGAQGFQGVAGTNGGGGAQGVQGAQGFQGVQGAPGTGNQGFQGVQGAQGFQGVAGVGAQGVGVSYSAIGVNTAAGSTGEIRATGDITAYYSDMRLKKYLGQIEHALLKLNGIQGFYYTGNEEAGKLGYSTEKREVGVSAQDVEKVLPEIIKPAPVDEKYMTLDYAKIVPLLIEAVKELNTKVDALQDSLRND